MPGRALLLIRINLAVGMIGSEDNPFTLKYGEVLIVGMIGTIVVRFRPAGMVRALCERGEILTTSAATFAQWTNLPACPEARA